MAAQTPEWQHPYVNLFKLCGTDQWKDVEKSGRIAEKMDAVIGKRVIRIQGTIPAVNYVKLPKGKGLNLNGRFCYIQVKLAAGDLFSIHVDVSSADGNTYRVSIGNIFKAEAAKKKASGIQIPVPHPPVGWCTFALDMVAALKRNTSSPFEAFKCIQLCSKLSVRGVFTSDIRFSAQTLPRDMILSHAAGASTFEMVWLPDEPSDVPTAPDLRAAAVKKGASRTDAAPASTEAGNAGPTSDLQPAPNSRDQLAAANPQNSPAEPTAKDTTTSAAADALPKQAALTKQASRDKAPAAATATASAPAVATGQEAAGPLGSEPCLELERINAFTGEFTRSLLWVPRRDELVFAAGPAVVAMAPGSTQQRHLLGHTTYVCAMAFDGEGSLLATAQEGKQAVVRLWDFESGRCLAVLCAHANSLVALDVSPDGRALLAVGQDSHAKQLMALWDISELRNGGQARLLLKQTTDYNIKVARFSAFEEDHFMTAGRDSIRCYRLKQGVLRGMSVHMQVPDKNGRIKGTAAASIALGPNIFTDIAYEGGVAAGQLAGQHVWVASAAGAVFQVNYARRMVVAVFQLHSGAINSLCVHDGLAATASDDRFLRIWPLDFSAYLLEAEHEAPVTSVGLSPNGLRACIGTEDGVVGTLDVVTHQYSTLVRSHCAAVNDVAVHPDRPEYCTASSDGTLRVWDLNSHQQLYEFNAPGEHITCAAYRPCDHGQYGQNQGALVCGFSSGIMRAFDVATTTLIKEQQQHRGAVMQLAFSPDGTRLFSAGADGTLCVYEAAQDYLPIKCLPPATSGHPACLDVSPDGQLLAAASHEPHRPGASLLVFDSMTLEPRMRIETDIPGFSKLAFAADSKELWALSVSGGQLDCFDLSDGRLLQHVPQPHRGGCTALALHPSGRIMATGGADQVLRLWACEPHQAQEAPTAANAVASGGAGTAADATKATNSTGSSRDATPAALRGLAFAGDRLVSVGVCDAVYVWRLKGAAAVLQQGCVALPKQHPDLNVVMRSWVQRGAVNGEAGSGRGGAGHGHGSGVQQERAVTGWPGSGPVTQTPTSPQRHRPLSSPPPLPGSHPAPRLAAAALAGFACTLPRGVLWCRASGALAFAADNALVLQHLDSQQQRFLQHHTRPIAALALSPDGTLIASGSAAPEPSGYAEVCVWDIRSGQLVRALQYHAAAVQGLAFSPDGVWLLSLGGAGERSVVLWELEGGEPVALGKTQGDIADMAWLPHRPLPTFLTAGADGLLLWTLQPTFLEQRALSIPDAATVVCTALATAAASLPHSAANGQIETDDMRRARELAGSCTVLVADAAGALWHCVVGDGQLLRAQRAATLPHGQTATLVQWSPVAGAVAVATDTGRVLRYIGGPTPANSTLQPAAAAKPWVLDQEVTLDGPVTSLVLEPQHLQEGLAATSSATAWYISLPNGGRVPLLCGHGADVTAFAASATQPGLVASTAEDGLLRLWEVGPTGTSPLAEFASSERCGAACFVASASQGDACAAGYDDGTVRLFDVSHSAVAWQVVRHPCAVVAVVAHPQQPLIMSASRDGLLAVTHADTSRLMSHSRHLTRSLTPLHALALCGADPGVAAAAWLDRFAVFTTPWESCEVEALAEYQCPEVPEDLPAAATSCIAFAPGATNLLFFFSPCAPNSVLLYNHATASTLRIFELPQPMCVLAPSPDGTLLAFGLLNGSVMVADAQGEGSTVLAGGTWRMGALAFTADSEQLLAAGGSTVYMWRRPLVEGV